MSKRATDADVLDLVLSTLVADGQSIEVGSLVGARVSRAIVTDTELWLSTDRGLVRFYHEQECCELVDLDDIDGPLGVLTYTTILAAEERTSSGGDGLVPRDESDRWTFYWFRTEKGAVTLRWHGSSNGYYSEEVSVKLYPVRARQEAGG